MQITAFLKMVKQQGRLNFFAVAPDQLGLRSFLGPVALNHISDPKDQYFFNAKGITKEKARQIEEEARKAPKGGSALQHFFIYSLQNLPTDSVGPLLKAVEDAKYSRFIFQTQSVPKKIRTLQSRSSVVHLPFMSRANRCTLCIHENKVGWFFTKVL